MFTICVVHYSIGFTCYSPRWNGGLARGRGEQRRLSRGRESLTFNVDRGGHYSIALHTHTHALLYTHVCTSIFNLLRVHAPLLRSPHCWKRPSHPFSLITWVQFVSSLIHDVIEIHFSSPSEQREKEKEKEKKRITCSNKVITHPNKTTSLIVVVSMF